MNTDKNAILIVLGIGSVLLIGIETSHRLKIETPWTTTLVLAVLSMIFIHNLSKRAAFQTKNTGWALMLFGIAVVAATVAFGNEFQGAKRWLLLPDSTPLRGSAWAILFYLAGVAVLVGQVEKPTVIEQLGVVGTMFAVLFGLCLMPDAFAIICLAITLLLCALLTSGVWRRTLSLVALSPILLTAVPILISPWRARRVYSWTMDTLGTSDPTGRGWALWQSRYAIDQAAWFRGNPDQASLFLPPRLDWYGIPLVANAIGLAAMFLTLLLLVAGSVFLLRYLARHETTQSARFFWVGAAVVLILNMLASILPPFGMLPFSGHYGVPLISAGESTMLALIVASRAIIVLRRERGSAPQSISI